MLKFNFTEEEKIFELTRTGNKITYEFTVLTDEKNTFLNWIKILSSPEFIVDVDLVGIRTKEFKNRALGDMTLFRVKASGLEKDLKRWQDNLDCIRKFLNGDYNITYITKGADQNAD